MMSLVLGTILLLSAFAVVAAIRVEIVGTGKVRSFEEGWTCDEVIVELLRAYPGRGGYLERSDGDRWVTPRRGSSLDPTST